MTDEEIQRKFPSLASSVLGQALAADMYTHIWNLDEEEDCGTLDRCLAG